MTNLLGDMLSDESVFGAVARTNRTAGDLTFNSTTWVTTGLSNLVIPAEVGDWVEVGVSAIWGNAAVNGRLDAFSIVAAAPVNSWADDAALDNTHLGVQAWAGPSGVTMPVGGSVVKQIVVGDLDSGTATIGLYYRTATAANKVISANAASPLSFWAANRRQP